MLKLKGVNYYGKEKMGVGEEVGEKDGGISFF